MDSKPCVLIVSSSSTKPKSLIKLITKQTPEDNTNSPNIIIHPWKLETKYYTTDINIIGITDDMDRDKIFNDSVEALIIHMDSNKESGLEDLNKWKSIESTCDPDIKLLVSNYCNNETKISKAKAMDWCLKRGYEFIELYPTQIETQEQDVIPEKFGVDRIIEALQAHVWSNLIMKDNCKGVERTENNIDDLGDFLTNEGSDDFTELFNQLHMMKDSIQSLPMRERKQCAEQMVSVFWKAIGGDEEEMADI